MFFVSLLCIIFYVAMSLQNYPTLSNHAFCQFAKITEKIVVRTLRQAT
jgi:hypothetical protein